MSSLYSKLREDLMEAISTMEKGEKLPSERQLCDDYDVSRTTVRNAIGSLVNAGILYQIQGKGTYVRDSEKENLSNYYSLTEQTRKNGKIPKSIVLSFKIEGIHMTSKTNWLNIRNPMQELICSITKYHTGITNTYACMYQLNIGSVLV